MFSGTIKWSAPYAPQILLPITNVGEPKFTYLKDKLSQRVPNMKGDLLVIRATFSIKRSDFNLMPGQFEEKVSDTIELTLSIAGSSPK
jgi:hypothetical protein